MFGDLFEEQNFTNENNFSEKAKMSLTKSVSRHHSGFCGLKNQGATCYLNSLLQTLASTPKFRDGILMLNYEELKASGNKKERKIPIYLQQLFGRMLFLNVDSVNTLELTESFGWTNNEAHVQQDVQEMTRVMMTALEDSFKDTSASSLVCSSFTGSLSNQITCCSCNGVSSRNEDFMDLCIPLGGLKSLQESLSSSYSTSEHLTSPNQYHCSNCDCLSDAQKTTRLLTLPPYLTFSLLRFNFDMRTFERYKDKGFFSFPRTLDMSFYCQQKDPKQCYKYRLYSVIVHSGGTHGGHYKALIRGNMCQNNYNNNNNNNTNDNDNNNNNNNNAKNKDNNINCKGDGINGSDNCPINSGNTNHTNLNVNGLNDTENDNESNLTESNIDHDIINNNTSIPTNHGNDANKDMWYEVDDTKITETTWKRVKQSFEGSETAYMLFYRAVKNNPDTISNGWVNGGEDLVDDSVGKLSPKTLDDCDGGSMNCISGSDGMGDINGDDAMNGGTSGMNDGGDQGEDVVWSNDCSMVSFEDLPKKLKEEIKMENEKIKHARSSAEMVRVEVWMGGVVEDGVVCCHDERILIRTPKTTSITNLMHLIQAELIDQAQTSMGGGDEEMLENSVKEDYSSANDDVQAGGDKFNGEGDLFNGDVDCGDMINGEGGDVGNGIDLQVVGQAIKLTQPRTNDDIINNCVKKANNDVGGKVNTRVIEINGAGDNMVMDGVVNGEVIINKDTPGDGDNGVDAEALNNDNTNNANINGGNTNNININGDSKNNTSIKSNNTNNGGTNEEEGMPLGMEDMQLHLLKQVFPGYYPITKLPCSTATLESYGIVSECQLLLWDGIQINGQDLKSGPKHLPIHVSITQEEDQSPEGTLPLGLLPQDTSLAALKKIVCTKLNTPSVDLYRIGKGRRIKLEGESKSLQELSVQNQDLLIVCRPIMYALAVKNDSQPISGGLSTHNNTSSLPVYGPEKQFDLENFVFIKYYNHLLEANNIFHTKTVSEDHTVAEAKWMILSSMGATDQVHKCCLCISLDSPINTMLPLLEESLMTKHSPRNTKFYLLPREPLPHQHVLVFVKSHLPGLQFSSNFEGEKVHQMVVDKEEPVSDMVQECREVLGASEFQVAKSDWMGEVGENIDNDKVSFSAAKICHGSLLHLIPCKSPTNKDLIQLKILPYCENHTPTKCLAEISINMHRTLHNLKQHIFKQLTSNHDKANTTDINTDKPTNVMYDGNNNLVANQPVSNQISSFNDDDPVGVSSIMATAVGLQDVSMPAPNGQQGAQIHHTSTLQHMPSITSNPSHNYTTDISPAANDPHLLQAPTLDVTVPPSEDHLRLFHLHDPHLTPSLLKLNSQSLTKLKLKNGSAVMVKFLKEEEQLDDHKVLLRLMVKMGRDADGFKDGGEMMWNVTAGSTSSSLHFQASKLLNIAPDQIIHLARADDQPHKAPFRIPLPEKKTVMKSGKKQQKKESNLRTGPYNICDLQRIFVIVSEGKEEVKDEDFCNEEQKERLNKIKQQKACKTTSEMKHKNQRTEHSIKISVNI